MRILFTILSCLGFILGMVLMQIDLGGGRASSDVDIIVPLAGFGLVALSAVTGIGVSVAHMIVLRREARSRPRLPQAWLVK